MKVLIIGNGFDLAHGLPTRYSDFLGICSDVMVTKIQWEDGKCIDIIQSRKSVDKERIRVFAEKIGEKKWGIFKKNAGCYWIKHFKQRKTVLGNKWLDFEEEIKRVLENLIYAMHGDKDTPVQLLDNQLITDLCTTVKKGGTSTYRWLFEKLLQEEKKLVLAMDIYMHDYIEKMDIKRLTFFQKNKFDKLLSFNYTRIYSLLYRKEIDCCYIHGEAKGRNNYSNIVLGFDDHYMDGTRVIPEIIPFEKYYQRIINKNDNQYFRWLENMEKENENEIHIYGHSLAPSDGDIIRNFILDDKIKNKIIIYYYDEIDRAEKVKNLAIVLGPDNLIELTGGINPTIQFKHT